MGNSKHSCLCLCLERKCLFGSSQITVNVYFSFSGSGRFKEKASILHKMAKKQCKEDGVSANGVTGELPVVFLNYGSQFDPPKMTR